MTEPTSEEHGGHQDLAHIHDALNDAYAEVLAEPRNQAEGLDRAACGPHIKHLAAIAAAAAIGGASAAQWRTDVLTSAGPAAADALDAAQTCMRGAGLWAVPTA